MRGKGSRERGVGGLGLIGILVVAAILIYLGAQMIPRQTGAGTGVTTAPTGTAAVPTRGAAAPTDRARGIECQSNLNQIRQAITMSRTTSEGMPASLADLVTMGVTPTIRACPVGGAGYAYAYDPRTGRVGCRYPGHERY
ncbi:MAG: hypothetical protein HY321_13245 [Armatimonadetes bacterium]|nr:hypothetical protein [Armatimonadota bacterium]